MLVDGNDAPVGEAGKARCHMRDGLLHRAFTALLFDGAGRLLLTRRSASKPLWPGCWDGTVASHPRASESYEEAADRRIPEEIGVRCRTDYLFKFEYHVPYRDAGSENEVCGTLAGMVEPGAAVSAERGEVSESAWAEAGELAGMVAKAPELYCPWMLVALHLLPGAGAPQKYGGLPAWTGARARGAFLEAARAHLPDGQWRLVAER